MSCSEISARKEMCFNRKLYKLAVLCGCEIKVLAAKPCSIKTDKKGVGTRRLKYIFLASSPLVTAPPSNLIDYIVTAPPPNLTRLLHNTASYAG